MKKNILGLALIAMSMVTFSSNAQTTSVKDNNCTATECTLNQKCDKACQNQKCTAKGQSRQQAAFNNMNLTDTQKAQIQALNEKRRETARQKAEAYKSDRQRGDSAARVAMRAERKQYLNDLKSIIGPENYVLFLESFYVQEQGPARVATKNVKAHKHDVKARKARKDTKSDKRQNNNTRQTKGETAQK